MDKNIKILTEEEVLANIRKLYRVSEKDAQTILQLVLALERAVEDIPPHLSQAALLSVQTSVYLNNKMSCPETILHYRNMMVRFYHHAFDTGNRTLAS